MLSSMIDHQIKIEKIEELEQFKNKINDMIITHEVRINNSIEDINKMKEKYDKTIVDNLTMPSYINANNQFKNIGEYILLKEEEKTILYHLIMLNYNAFPKKYGIIIFILLIEKFQVF